MGNAGVEERMHESEELWLLGKGFDPPPVKMIWARGRAWVSVGEAVRDLCNGEGWKIPWGARHDVLQDALVNLVAVAGGKLALEELAQVGKVD